MVDTKNPFASKVKFGRKQKKTFHHSHHVLIVEVRGRRVPIKEYLLQLQRDTDIRMLFITFPNFYKETYVSMKEDKTKNYLTKKRNTKHLLIR